MDKQSVLKVCIDNGQAIRIVLWIRLKKEYFEFKATFYGTKENEKKRHIQIKPK